MADRYWVGGGSSSAWAATGNTNWALSSGGANNAAVPTGGDNVFFDANSGAGICSISVSTAVVGNFITTGFAGSISHSGSAIIQLGTTSTLFTLATGTFTGGAASKIRTAIFTGRTLLFTSGGNSLGIIDSNNSVNNRGTLQLQDDLTCTGITFGGTGTGYVFDTNNKAVNITGSTGFNFSGTTARTLTLGSSIITLNGSGSVWNMTTTTGLTFNANTSTINLTGSPANTFIGGGLTYYNVNRTVASTNIFTVTGSNTFHNFTYSNTKAGTLKFTAGTTQIATAFSINGSSGFINAVQSTVSTSQFTLSQVSGTVTANYVNLRDSVATGGASFRAVNSTDSGNNLGWIFSAPPISGILTWGAVANINGVPQADIATWNSVPAASIKTLNSR